jgi:hypothetical protein
MGLKPNIGIIKGLAARQPESALSDIGLFFFIFYPKKTRLK